MSIRQQRASLRYALAKMREYAARCDALAALHNVKLAQRAAARKRGRKC